MSVEIIRECCKTLKCAHIKNNIDDLGYCSFSRECSEMLFNLLSNRNDSKSILITTNLTFDRWKEIFGDEVLTGCIVDRLAHRAHIVDMTGESYRVIDTRKWMEGVRKTES